MRLWGAATTWTTAATTKLVMAMRGTTWTWGTEETNHCDYFFSFNFKNTNDISMSRTVCHLQPQYERCLTGEEDTTATIPRHHTWGMVTGSVNTELEKSPSMTSTTAYDLWDMPADDATYTAALVLWDSLTGGGQRSYDRHLATVVCLQLCRGVTDILHSSTFLSCLCELFNNIIVFITPC